MGKFYTLYNKLTEKKLIHPKIGLWYTTNLDEAKIMLQDCKNYLDFIKTPDIKDYLIIIDVETEEEVES